MNISLNPGSKFTKMIIIAELILVTYLLYTLTVSVYKSYQIDRVIQEFERENARIAKENQQKVADLEYFTSPNYIEKITKQNLGLVKPGEEVIVLEKLTPDVQEKLKLAEQQNEIAELSNLEKWYFFIFDRNQ